MAALAAAAPFLTSCASTARPRLETRLMADIQHYVRLGWHRTGSEGDQATAAWLAERLSRAGFRVSPDPFEVETLSVADAQLTVGGQSIPCALQWAPDPIRGEIVGPLMRFGEEDAHANALALLPDLASVAAYWTPQADALVTKVAHSGAKALVVCVNTPGPGPYLFNREPRPPLPIPVIVAGRESFQALQSAAEKRTAAHLSLNVVRSKVRTQNVLAEIGSGDHAIVVSTPMTGWFSCGAERGPGIAIMLALAPRLAKLNRRVVLACSSGHEIGHAGMDRILKQAPTPERVGLWVHLGASIGVPRDRAVPSIFATPNARPIVEAGFRHLPMGVAPSGAKAPGETGTVINAGYASVLGFAGGNPDFHTARDNGATVDPALLSQIFDALSTIVDRFAA